LEVAHGLGVCGLPVVPHLITDGALERKPELPYAGIRFLVTDLHILGPTQTNPAQYISALIRFIKQLVSPSTYLVVFWSNYAEEATDAWDYLSSRIPPELKPFGYEVLSKVDASAAANGDEVAIKRIRDSIEAIIQKYPQLKAVMEWEAHVSRAATDTTNQLMQTLVKGGAKFEQAGHVRTVLARMAQEALGYPHAINAPSKGLTQALLPILQDILEWAPESHTKALSGFLGITKKSKIKLPSDDLAPLLNDFFIHAEGNVSGPLERGASIRLDEAYLTSPNGFFEDIGLCETAGDWSEAMCNEFYVDWKNKRQKPDGAEIKAGLEPKNVYAIELSAVCDHAQNKQRTQRFLLALFVPTYQLCTIQNEKGELAHAALYMTPDITIDSVVGRLLISFRTFIARPHETPLQGDCITRLRKDVVEEVAHQYASHMRRPGKIAFY
jgi:hypothetical protein